MKILKKVEIFTDGACSKNPGPGGWAAILRYGTFQKKICGFVSDTTNNRMELFALISALSMIKYPCDISIFSDSKYVVDSISRGRVFKWAELGWKRKNKEIPNADLWQELIDLMKKHTISVHWQKGHNGNVENEECDKMATMAIRRNLVSV